jgi:hypothetical protein
MNIEWADLRFFSSKFVYVMHVIRYGRDKAEELAAVINLISCAGNLFDTINLSTHVDL